MKTLAIEDTLLKNSIEYYIENQQQFFEDLSINLAAKIRSFIMEEITLSDSNHFKYMLLSSLNNNCMIEIAKEYITQEDFQAIFNQGLNFFLDNKSF